MKVVYSRRAFRDREAILDYLHKQSPVGERNVLARFEHAVRLLGDPPSSGVPTDVGNVRVLFVGRYPYKIFYKITGDTVELVHIRHTSRSPSEFG
ncbi:MAG: type II toxin-antitoxin system RelE/ParE family toxin [Mesorhizobium sp.]|nr:type II toxin-antitoxin system RelE/ParE family toxin [Mesorhizobium sp.]